MSTPTWKAPGRHPRRLAAVAAFGALSALGGLVAPVDAPAAAQTRAPAADASTPEGREALALRARQLNLRADELARQRRYTEAIAAAREALALGEQVHGKAHPSIAADLVALASLYRSQGNLSNAEAAARRAVDIGRQVHGERHPEVGVDLTVLAQLLEHRGYRAEAVRTYREAIDLLGAPGANGRFQAQQAQTRYMLARLLMGQRRAPEAMTEFDAALPVLERETPQLAVNALLTMAEFERANGRQEQAQGLLDRANKVRTR